MYRAIVNVSTGNVASGRYLDGQERLVRSFPKETIVRWTDCVPKGSPPHYQRPYAFKAYAMKQAAERYPVLLWCDACILPGERPLEDLWRKIEDKGCWIANNGFTNYEWTADTAYPELFFAHDGGVSFERAREINRGIPHVVATAFGIDTRHLIGAAILSEYFRLAQTNAFHGPRINANFTTTIENFVPMVEQHPKIARCGPHDVRGHRHDQTALSVIAWRLGVKLTNCPEWFSYRGGETAETCLVADGKY